MDSLEPSRSQWIGDLAHTRLIFYSGGLQSQVHAGQYIGNNDLVTTTNEKFVFRRPSIFTIHRESLWLYPEIPEVEKSICEKEGEQKTWSDLWSDWTFYISSNIKGAYLGEPLPTFVHSSEHDYIPSYPVDEGGSLTKFRVNNVNVSFGQQTDKAAHHKRVVSMQEACPDNASTVLYGVSRGAATTFSALSANQKDYKNIKLCVLEAPFDSIEGVAQTMFKSNRLGSWLYNQAAIRRGFLGEQHNVDRIDQPRGHASSFPNDIPTVIISSIKDDVVPHKNTMRLALRVAIKRREAKVLGAEVAPLYFLQLDNATHVRACNKGTPDAERYECFIHHLYRKHNLPYIASFAEQCNENEEITDLTSNLMAPFIQAQQHYWNNKPDRQKIRHEALALFFQQLDSLDLNLLDEGRMLKFAKEMPLFSGRLEDPSQFFSTRKMGDNAVKKLSERMEYLVKHSKFEENDNKNSLLNSLFQYV